jgi:hypothetical protein
MSECRDPRFKHESLRLFFNCSASLRMSIHKINYLKSQVKKLIEKMFVDTPADTASTWISHRMSLLKYILGDLSRATMIESLADRHSI